MKNLKRILAVTDFSPLGDAAARRGALLAARENSEFLIAHAIPGESALNSAFGATGGLPTRMRAVAENRLAALVQAARDLGVRRVRAEIVEGTTQRTVADMTDRYEPDPAGYRCPWQRFAAADVSRRHGFAHPCPY